MHEYMDIQGIGYKDFKEWDSMRRRKLIFSNRHWGSSNTLTNLAYEIEKKLWNFHILNHERIEKTGVLPKIK